MTSEKAEEFLEIAELAYNNGAYNSCVNRVYYSMRWLMIKALEREGFIQRRWSHGELLDKFDSELILNKQIYSKEFRGYIKFAYAQRIIADYMEEQIGKDVANSILGYAKGIKRKIVEMIK
jgi:uncharacterized protein (UPF0332 family)